MNIRQKDIKKNNILRKKTKMTKIKDDKVKQYIKKGKRNKEV